MRNSRSWRLAAALAAFGSVWFGHPTTARADAITDWNIIALNTSGLAAENGIRRTRSMAIVHTAIHDALNLQEGGGGTRRVVRTISADGKQITLEVRITPEKEPAEERLMVFAR